MRTRAVPSFPFSFAFVASCALARGQSIEQVSVADDGSEANVDCVDVSISDDGMRVAFRSPSANLVAGDTNRVDDAFVRDRLAGTTTRVDVSSSGAQANARCLYPRISGDGNFVVFMSDATNLVANDVNGMPDIFVRDLAAGTTTLVSVSSGGAAGNDGSYLPALSADGRYVAFASSASNLVAGDTNFCIDTFVRDRTAGTTVRVSVAANGTQANSNCSVPAISRDGRYVTFISLATNLDPNDSDAIADLYLRDTIAGTLTLLSVDSNGVKGNDSSSFNSISDDGRYIAFATRASNFVAGDVYYSEDVFLRDVVAQTTTCMSVDSDGNLAVGPPSFGSGNPDITGDGRFVAFASSADNLADDDFNGSGDVFTRELRAAVTTRSVRGWDGSEADSWNGNPRLSIDGTSIAFLSKATNLVASGSNGRWQVFVVDRRIDVASSANYGSGLGGTHGVPSLSVNQLPVLHRVVDLQIGNSWGAWSVGLLLLGTQRAQLPTGWGGDVLLLPILTALLPLPPAGSVLSYQLPDDERLVGGLVDLQVLELDPGAIDGVSFTDGLELVIGY